MPTFAHETNISSHPILFHRHRATHSKRSIEVVPETRLALYQSHDLNYFILKRFVATAKISDEELTIAYGYFGVLF
jgi:hypothetical protein